MFAKMDEKTLKQNILALSIAATIVAVAGLAPVRAETLNEVVENALAAGDHAVGPGYTAGEVSRIGRVE